MIDSDDLPLSGQQRKVVERKERQLRAAVPSLVAQSSLRVVYPTICRIGDVQVPMSTPAGPSLAQDPKSSE